MHSKLAKVISSGLAILVGAGMLLAATLPSVGKWNFDEPNGVVANDSSGFRHNGMLYGAAAFVQDADFGNALQIYGPSGQVAVPHDVIFQPETGTITLWVKPAILQNGDLVRKSTDLLVNRNQSGTFYAYGLRLRKDASVEAVIGNDDPTATTWFTSARSKASLVSKNQWTHLAMRWDGNVLSVFINGKLVAAATYTEIPGSGLSYHGTSDLLVGALFGDLEFNGCMSGLHLYGTALSEADIFSEYSTKAPAPSTSTKGGKTR